MVFGLMRGGAHTSFRRGMRIKQTSKFCVQCECELFHSVDVIPVVILPGDLDCGIQQKSLDHGNYKSHFHSCLINRTGHRDSFPVFAWKVTLDYQLIVIPAYNRDRGPISVLGFRVHTAEFERLAVRKCRSFRFGTLP